MKIPVQPKFLECAEYWQRKAYGVVLVQKESDIEPLFQALCEQDDYWESYKNLIKVAPDEVINDNIDLMCEYCGKCDIYDVKELKEKMSKFGIEFILYQTNYWD